MPFREWLDDFSSPQFTLTTLRFFNRVATTVPFLTICDSQGTDNSCGGKCLESASAWHILMQHCSCFSTRVCGDNRVHRRCELLLAGQSIVLRLPAMIIWGSCGVPSFGNWSLTRCCWWPVVTRTADYGVDFAPDNVKHLLLENEA